MSLFIAGVIDNRGYGYLNGGSPQKSRFPNYSAKGG
jgi:hypothetical protein